MITHCKKCGTSLPNAAIECPKCKTIHAENVQAAIDAASESKPKPEPAYSSSGDGMMGFPEAKTIAAQTKKLKAQVEQLRTEKDSLAVDIANLTIAQVRSWFSVWRFLMGFTILMAFGCAILVYRIYTGTDHFINQAVAKKLEPAVLDAKVEKIAKKQITKKLEAQLDPLVETFQQDVKNLRHELQSSKTEFDLKYEELAGQVQVMNDRRHILKLMDHAMKGSHRAYRELVAYRETATLTELASLAAQQITHIQGYFAGKQPLLSVHVNYTNEEGQGLIDASVPTEPLINAMLNSPHWKVRAKAAVLLRDRVEAGVPEALLLSAEKDPMLDVVKEALATFSVVTGYPQEQLFETSEAKSWWENFNPASQDSNSKVEVYELETS